MSLRDLKQVPLAWVHKKGVPAATLTRDRTACTFAYLPAYDGAALASTLPRADAPRVHAPGVLPAFFAGLLPEGRRMTALRRAIKTSADDDFSLLLAVGGQTIGDVTVHPEQFPESDPSPVSRADLRAQTFDDLYARVLAPDPADRVGLPGVQAKLSDGMINLPLTWGDQPAILKLNPPEFAHVVHNEAFFLGLAGAAGFEVPRHEIIHDAAGEPGLLIQRFDRSPPRTPEASWFKHAQEDACQVLGLYPADKYTPTTTAMIHALATPCASPRLAARELFARVVFAYLTCNGDAHAKNFSILQHRTGEWRVSPLYDVPTTHPYGDTTMALSICGREQEDIGRAHFLQLADQVDLPARAAERVLRTLCDTVRKALPTLDALPFDPRRRHKLARAMQVRLAQASGQQAG